MRPIDPTQPIVPGGGGGGGGAGGGGPGISLPIFPPINIGGGGGGGAVTGPRIITDTGILAGQNSQATVVVPPTTAAAPGQGGTGPTTTTTYQWTISGGRITSDPTRQTVTFTADAAGTLSLNVVVSTAGAGQSTSADVIVLSPALAGTITVPATTATNATPFAASVPAAQSGDRTFRWTVAGSGAAVASGQGTNAVTVRPGAPGLLEVMCDVTLQRLATVTLRSFVVVTGDGPPSTLTVNGGSGSGTYPTNSRVDIFANPPGAGQVFDKWTGDTAILGNAALAPSLAHVVVTIPAASATLTATYKPVPEWSATVINNFNPLATASSNGTTLAYHIPTAARGLVFLLHDTGGSGAIWFTGPEQLTLARDLVAAGFGVAALSSVNRTTAAWAGQAALATNPDALMHAAALDRFVRDGLLTADKPVFFLGMANGADAAARYADLLAKATPPRPVKGAIVYCTSGNGTLAVTSHVPEFFALASHDDSLGTAGNAGARENSQLLAGRGVATAVISNASSPVHPGRFRILGTNSAMFTAADAQAIWTAIKAAGFLDANNYPKTVPTIDAVRTALPTAYQSRASEVLAQLAVGYAAQEFYSDANARVIAFLNSRATDAPTPAPGRMVNLSTRTKIAYLGDSFTLGFNLTGTQRATLLIRGIGPALTKFGLAGALPALRLEVNQRDTLVAANEGWDKANNAAQIAAAATAVGAFPLGAGELDTAVLLTLDPGSYTATIKGLNGATGDVLAEVYDVSKNSTRLTNLSTLGTIASDGELLIPGLVIAGNNPRTLLVRAVGPGLASVGVPASSVLADPRVSILSGTGQNVATNNNWAQGGAASDAAMLSAAFPAVGAFPLNAASNDAALVNALAPGSYTLPAGAAPGAAAQLPANAVGTILVEIYEVP